MKSRAKRSIAGALVCCGLLLLNACGGGDSTRLPDQADSSDAIVGSSQSGTTPFIGFVSFRGAALARVASIRFSIEPKLGSASKPVGAKYSIAGLRRRGYVSIAGNAVTLPVFGLYAGFTNRISVQLTFDDASIQTLSVQISTDAYVDPAGVYDRPAIRQARSAGTGLGFDFFFMKSSLGSPVVVDTDGEIRWVGAGLVDAKSSAFQNGGFVIGDASAAVVRRVELDGTITESSLTSSIYTNFHHNLDEGKQGLLAELDSVAEGVRNIESNVAEISPSGVVLNEWDLAALLEKYMRSQGDDPTSFVRPGIDWFHVNAATYDPRDDSLIVSSRENFVIKLDYTSGNVLWIFGDPTKYWYTFPSLRAKALVLDSGGLYPIGQHATSITSDGLLMLFNDGLNSINQPAGAPTGESRTYSAVSAYAVDPRSLTAREMWRFDYGQSIYSDICSSAYEAGGKSLLISYAVAENRTKARLVGLDGNRNVVFDFEYPTSSCSTSWNAQPIAFDNLSID
ncbi:MAG: aryl-sulfate sulfotransferase [Burkholderiales bacterium]